jgi:RimJ/RimL family protein N-acetyltransferase
MEEEGIHQWDSIYPDTTVITEDIVRKQLSNGVIDGKIAVCFVLSEDYDEEYKNGQWQWPESKFCIIHRLCVSPDFQNKGIAAETLKYIEKLCKSQGYDSIRLDCFTENPYSRKLYDKAGYSVVGYADWRKGRFELREKKL